MTNQRAIQRLAVALLAVTLGFPCAVAAQSIWLDGQSRKDITLEFYQPQFKTEEWSGYYWKEWRKLSGLAFFLTYRFPVSQDLILVAELPFAHGGCNYGYSYEDPYWGSYERSGKFFDDALGNPYIGIKSRSENSGLFFELGARIPILGEDEYPAGSAGFFADLDRFEAFSTECLVIQGAGNLRVQSQGGVVGRARLAPHYCIYTSGWEGGDRTQLFLHYSVQFGYEQMPIGLLAGLSGVVILTEDRFLGRNDPSVNHLGFQGNISLGKFRPGVHFGFPLDDELKQIYSSVWGLSLQYQFD
jgi:hypothetical protein